MNKIKVALVDDHTIVREGFKVLLNASDNIEVISEAADGDLALEMLKNNAIDVLISDVYMPNMNGIELCEEINKSDKKVPILLLSMYNNKEYFVKALKAGASGYLLKDCEKEELCLAIKKVANGDTYFGNSISSALMRNMILDKKNATPTSKEITSRERDVLLLAMEGLSTKAIAERLFISARTVDKHRANIMEKFQVHSIVELINYIRKNNIL
jgi:DNA-binding NarL/FixJ family response regulator